MRRPRRLVAAAGLALGLLLVGVLVAWGVARSVLGPPQWYAPPEARTSSASVAAAAGTLGERVEYRLVEELQRVRPPAERWSVRLTDEQANAWLAARLPAWWRTETGDPWPEDLRPPQLRSTGASLTVVLGVGLPGLEAGLVTTLRPWAASGVGAEAGAGDSSSGGTASGLRRVGLSFHDLRLGRTGARALAAGDLVIEAAGVAGEDAERLRVILADPGAALDELIEAAATSPGDDPDTDVMAGGMPIRLADGRRVRLLAVGLERGAITLSFVAPGRVPAGE